MAEAEGALPAQRIDKWLWYARVVKSRSLAQKLVTAGHVRVNREKVTTASKSVRIGDVLTVSVARSVRILKVLAPGERRGPAPEARLLYEDLTPPPPPRDDPVADPGAPAIRAPGSGRPTKRERREIDRFRQGEG